MTIIFILLITLVIVGLVAYICRTLKQRQQIITINTNIQKENIRLKTRNKQLRQDQIKAEQQLKNIVESVKSQDNILSSLQKTAQSLQNDAEERANEFYKTRLAEIQSTLDEQYKHATADKEGQLSAITLKITQEEEKLRDLEAKQLAYIEAKKRQEEIEQNEDFYRLTLDELDINDIKLLRELQPRFLRKESIDKLIWEVYYKPAYDKLAGNLFLNKDKVCGIYKITDLKTGAPYIGQSVDIRERWRQHIKASLAYGKATNKLYQAMQKSQLYNFTFEVLEEVSRDKLNERETYWIDFYKTKDYGLNSTRGSGA